MVEVHLCTAPHDRGVFNGTTADSAVSIEGGGIYAANSIAGPEIDGTAATQIRCVVGKDRIPDRHRTSCSDRTAGGRCGVFREESICHRQRTVLSNSDCTAGRSSSKVSAVGGFVSDKAAVFHNNRSPVDRNRSTASELVLIVRPGSRFIVLELGSGNGKCTGAVEMDSTTATDSVSTAAIDLIGSKDRIGNRTGGTPVHNNRTTAGFSASFCNGIPFKQGSRDAETAQIHHTDRTTA